MKILNENVGNRAGLTAMAAFGLCAVSGVALSRGYDPDSPMVSIGTWLLASRWLTLVRAVHFWATLVLIGAVLVHLAARLRMPFGTHDRSVRTRPVTWLALAAGVVLVGFLALTGYLLRGDPTALAVRESLRRFLTRGSVVDPTFTTLLLGRPEGLGVVYFQHAALAPLLVLLLLLAQSRRLWPGPFATAGVTIGVLWLALLVSPGLGDGGRRAAWRLAPVRPRPVPGAPLVVVRGRPEGCLTCHVAMSGLGKSHDPATIGCASCHLGDAYASDAPRAHAGMVRVPGNLADAPRTCGQTGCHDAIVPRVQRSIMTTFAGVIAVDREAFGEAPNHGAAGPPDITGLGHSAADTHLRQLCASCHLGQPKTEWGPNSEATRGGGCNACHLTYDREAARQLVAYDRIGARPGMTGPTAHPSLTIAIPNDNCFGCHSRSGRISTNYEGWMELRTDPPAAEAHRPIYRQLADGRFFVRAGADVHAEKGMDCIDCHTANETMGKGMAVARKYDQQQVRCEDCHTRQFATVDPRGVDSETEKLLQLRGAVPAAGTRLGTTASGEPLANVWVTGGAGELRRKRTGQSLPLRPPVAACDAGKGHARLSCESCHTAWTPRCASCHTSFNPQAEGFDHLRQEFGPGAWEETAGDYAAAPPTLGIRKVGPGDAASAGVVDTFAPGMIMDLDRNRDPAKKPDVVFRRLYARVAPHTTRREARSCASCHADPVALGYGEGELRYEVSGATGRWRFTPRHAALADGRPADAWIGFLETRTDVASTRPDVRPFTADEQRRILAVGACLTCHAGDSPVMQDALRDFAAAQARHSPRCAMPGWKR